MLCYEFISRADRKGTTGLYFFIITLLINRLCLISIVSSDNTDSVKLEDYSVTMERNKLFIYLLSIFLGSVSHPNPVFSPSVISYSTVLAASVN